MNKDTALNMVDDLIKAARLPDDLGAWEGGELRHEISSILASADRLGRLFDSSLALQERFGDDWTLKAAINKVNEELDEFKLELQYLTPDNLPVTNVQAAFEELIDVVVTMFSCLIKLGIKGDSARFYLEHCIDAVIAKNDTKTLETHERVRGDIVKRSKG